MVRGGLGGGNTQTGIHFEGRVDIVTYLNDEVDGYRCEQKTLNNKNQSMGFNIYYNGNLVAESFKKHELYRYLDALSVDWRRILSKQLLVNSNYIIEESDQIAEKIMKLLSIGNKLFYINNKFIIIKL